MRTNLDTVKRNLGMGRATMDDLEALVREVESARAAVGEAWFSGGATLAEAIRRKCRMLEEDAAKVAAELERFRRDKMACENSPWLGCTCPGCETERARALNGGSDG